MGCDQKNQQKNFSAFPRPPLPYFVLHSVASTTCTGAGRVLRHGRNHSKTRLESGTQVRGFHGGGSSSEEVRTPWQSGRQVPAWGRCAEDWVVLGPGGAEMTSTGFPRSWQAGLRREERERFDASKKHLPHPTAWASRATQRCPSPRASIPGSTGRLGHHLKTDAPATQGRRT